MANMNFKTLQFAYSGESYVPVGIYTIAFALFFVAVAVYRFSLF